MKLTVYIRSTSDKHSIILSHSGYSFDIPTKATCLTDAETTATEIAGALLHTGNKVYVYPLKRKDNP